MVQASHLPLLVAMLAACHPSTQDSASWLDGDGDGVHTDADCDDANPAAGGGEELPYNGVDDDCDPDTPDDDLDGDGYPLAHDEDDQDPDHVATHGPPWEGDLAVTDGHGFCDGYTYRTVTGDLAIDTDDAGLAELTCLRHVGGMLTIRSQRSLVTLTGLDALQTVGGLVVDDNTGLQGLSGLGALVAVGEQGLYLGGNDALTDLSALAGLASVQGGLTITDSNGVQQLEGLGSLGWVGGDLVLSRMVEMDELGSLDSLTAIGGALELSDLSLTHIDGQFPQLSTVGRDLIIEDCDDLVWLGGLPQLVSVGDDLLLDDLDAVEGIEAFEALQTS